MFHHVGYFTTSGWGLLTTLWTDKVKNLYDTIRFSLTAHDKDRLFDGSFYACHAEKQLIAYYIDQHFF